MLPSELSDLLQILPLNDIPVSHQVPDGTGSNGAAPLDSANYWAPQRGFFDFRVFGTQTVKVGVRRAAVLCQRMTEEVQRQHGVG